MEKPPDPENTEGQIERLLGELDNYDHNRFPEEIVEEWYYVNLEARVGEDRGQALERLRQFIDKLSKTPKKEA